MAFKLQLPSLKGIGKVSGADGSSLVDRPLPLIGHLPFNKQFQMLGAATAAALLIGMVAGALDARTTSNGAHYQKLSGDLVFLTQRLAKEAALALQGKQDAIEALPEAREQAEHILTVLDKGDDTVPATSGAAREALDKLLPEAQKSLQLIKDVEAGRPGVLTVSRAADVVKELGPELRDTLKQLSASGADSQRVTQFSLLVERIGRDVAGMNAGGSLGDEAASQALAALGSDLLDADELLSSFNASNPAVIQLNELFDSYRNTVEAVVSQVQVLFTAKQSVSEYFDSVSLSNNGPFVANARALSEAYQASLSGRLTSYIAIVAFTVLLLLLALFAKVFLADARHRAQLAEASNKRNQQAILRLMNELSDLSEGDLSIKATVSEDITGAIADSINYTTEELRRLVSRVLAASQQVSKATNDASTVSKELLEATKKQALEIRDAGGAVDLMSKSIQEVDSSASQSSKVARRTLEVTEQGALAVRNSVAGMDGIREQIQDTSKRIKRLGESSQEIGEIVDLISDITEQTNVLALNAAIQASSAGEAGRGFAVVAAEVQRLAERSAEATKQIGLLVKTIQGDTQDAVAAMEKSTQGVVEGAKLSDEAGKSLHEIELSTRELTDLVNSISVSTQVQTDMAREVALVMADILKISEQTSTGTQRTSASVTQLEALANELNGSVAGFKL
ncbi:MAG: methyl-accepting chemotaxis protein [Gallionella sp.]|nr:methyl-accepting chemotaxis protein [Gallionella sp.]